MPIKCHRVENRSHPRVWTAKKVGQVFCIALRGGVPRADLEAEIRKCTEPDRKPGSSEAVEALIAAAQALEQNNEMINADAAFLERFNIFASSLGVAWRLIARFFRPAAALAVTTVALEKLATARIEQLTVRKAANDVVIRIVRRAAANASNFLRTGTGG